MEDMTIAEMTRTLGDIRRRQDDFVSKELHNNVINNIQEDLREIKDGQTWMMRLLVGELVGFLIAVLYYIISTTA